MDTVYTRKQFAKMLDINVNTLRNWEKNKQIEAPRRIGRRVYFTESQVLRIMGEAK